jgi:tellurite methyltransferase
MRNPWALEYARNPERFIWGTVPSRLARDLAALVPSGARVLDLGCGEGRDSVYFASRGYEVTGLDVSAAGLEKAERLANERGVTVRWLCRSILDHSIEQLAASMAWDPSRALSPAAGYVPPVRAA